MCVPHVDRVEDTAPSGAGEPQLIHRLFESQADRTPDAAAVELDGRSVSYRELDAAANRLAHRLCDAGAGPGKLVAICLDRSTEMVLAVLAVLKSGSAYVPLDPAYPSERLGAMLEDSRPAVVVTDASLSACLPPHAGLTFRLDEQNDRAAVQGSSRPQA